MLAFVALAALVAAPAAIAAPANDHFAQAQVLPVPPVSAPGTTVDATQEADDPTIANGGSVWYRWTASSTDPVRLNTCTTAIDTVVGVFTGSSLATLDEVATDDDGCDSGRGSSLEFEATGGTTYSIAVFGYDSDDRGTFNLQIAKSVRRLSIQWSTDADIDAHVFTANEDHAYFSDRGAIADGLLSPDIIPEAGDFSAHEEHYTDFSGAPLNFCIFYYAGSGAPTSVSYAISDFDGTTRTGVVTLRNVQHGVWVGSSPAGYLPTSPSDDACFDLAPQRRYVALGDSYSSGEGAGNYSGGGCHRSAAGWPNVLSALSSRMELVTNLACSGAETEALTQAFNGQLPQLDALPGGTELVTVTIGGNDVGFGRVMKACFVRNCIRSGNLDEAQAQIQNQLPTWLLATYGEIQQRLNGAEFIVVGYPRITPTGGDNCLWLTKGEKKRLNALTILLDRVIGDTATDAGAKYISTLNALNGHELCTGNSWLFPIKNRAVFDGNLRQQAAHPLPDGQRAIASVVAGVTG